MAAMRVGLALPPWPTGRNWSTWLDGRRITDDWGPFSSISCGERITFRNTEMITTLSAAAACADVEGARVRQPRHRPVALHETSLPREAARHARRHQRRAPRRRSRHRRAWSRMTRPSACRWPAATRWPSTSRSPRCAASGPVGPPRGRAHCSDPRACNPAVPRSRGALGPKATARAAAEWATACRASASRSTSARSGRAIDMAATVWRDAGRHESPRYVVVVLFARVERRGDAPPVHPRVPRDLR